MVMSVEAGSVQANLRARRASWVRGHEKIAVPGYGGELVGVYDRARWEDLQPLVLAVIAAGETGPGQEDAASLLVAANVGFEAHVDGQVAEIKDDAGQPVKMGLGLARFLGIDLEGVDTDEQAVFLIFESDVALMEHALTLVNRQRAREAEAGQKLAGN